MARTSIRVVLGVAIATPLLLATSVSAASAPRTLSAARAPGLRSTPLATTPREPAPIDVGLLRLWLPSGWTLAAAEGRCSGRTHRCAPSCAPGPSDTVELVSAAISFTCSSARARTDAAVWIVPERRGTSDPTRRAFAFSAGSVIISAPQLGVRLYGLGAAGARVAETYTHSALDDVLRASLPAVVPSDWTRVHLGRLSLEAPPSWPRRTLRAKEWWTPGTCLSPYFPHPIVDVGEHAGNEIFGCTLITATTELDAYASPSDGAWLQSQHGSNPRSAWVAPLGPGRLQLRREYGLRLELSVPSYLVGSNFLEVAVHHDGKVGEVLLGLGRNPNVALAMLSSLRFS